MRTKDTPVTPNSQSQEMTGVSGALCQEWGAETNVFFFLLFHSEYMIFMCIFSGIVSNVHGFAHFLISPFSKSGGSFLLAEISYTNCKFVQPHMTLKATKIVKP